EILNFVEFLSRHHKIDSIFSHNINNALQKSRSAYRLVDKCIVPYVNDAEGQMVINALAATGSTRFQGAHNHILDAGRSLTNGQWADSIRNSIHAVEAVVVQIDEQSNTLSAAL